MSERRLAIAKRNGQPAYVNAPPRQRGDMKAWLERERPRGLWARIFGGSR